MPEKDNLDRLLDSALSSYADPDPGLAERILAHVSREGSSVGSAFPWHSRRVLWGVALPAAACLLFVFFELRSANPPVVRPSSHLQKPPSTTAQTEPPFVPSARSAQTASAPSHRSHSSAVVAAKPAHPPKLDVFPAPQPLSPEEQALYAFATQVPEKQRQAILEARKNDDAPLKLDAIQIPPIEMPDTGKN